MQVDSVLYRGKTIPFTYNDTILSISLPNMPANIEGAEVVTILYHGKPQKDRSWGGFYRTADYAYHMGVGFMSDPHPYGRIWHPCFDNFAEKALYDIELRTHAPFVGHANGLLVSRQLLDGIYTSRWLLQQPICSYLASFAVGRYIRIQRKHQGEAGPVPIEIACMASDSKAVERSFQHLTDCIDAFEHWYGPHRFDKVGYSLVPFRSGAMEHATNISYPIYAANNGLKNEDLMAHELAHSWWGNNVTCEDGSEMWINEGMASFSELLFYEWVYGKERYRQEAELLQRKVVRTSHKADHGYHPITAVPFDYTYGSHVYNKGALVAHNLRSYLGDSLFRVVCRNIQTERAFDHLTSIQFMRSAIEKSGMDLVPFFSDWVFRPGFPAFMVHDLQSVRKDRSTFQTTAQIQQWVLGRQAYFRQLPVVIELTDTKGKTYRFKQLLDSTQTVRFDTKTPIQMMVINPDNALLLADRQYPYLLHPKQAIPPTDQLPFDRLEMTNCKKAQRVSFTILLSNDWAQIRSSIPFPADAKGVFQLQTNQAAPIRAQNKERGTELFRFDRSSNTWQSVKPKESSFILGSGIYAWMD